MNLLLEDLSRKEEKMIGEYYTKEAHRLAKIIISILDDRINYAKSAVEKDIPSYIYFPNGDDYYLPVSKTLSKTLAEFNKCVDILNAIAYNERVRNLPLRFKEEDGWELKLNMEIKDIISLIGFLF